MPSCRQAADTMIFRYATVATIAFADLFSFYY